MSTIGLGMIGAGHIAEFTARDFARHPGCTTVAVADPSTERAEALAGQIGCTSVHARADALLARHDVDAVYIAVPNALHESVATRALAAGKHVLLEKPFALSARQAEDIIAAAKRADRILMLGMNQRFERNVQRAKKLVDGGRLGDVYHVKAHWRRRAGIPRMGSWFTSRDVAGGGALLDIGVHVLDVALHLLGNFEPLSVSGATFTRFGNRGLGEGGWGRSEREFEVFDVDDFATALIRLEGGVVISLEAAWALHQPSGNDHDVVLYGDDAGLSVFSDALYEAGADGEYHIVQSPSGPPIDFPHCSRAHHFVNVLLGEESSIIQPEEALAVQRILDAIYESAANNREVVL